MHNCDVLIEIIPLKKRFYFKKDFNNLYAQR